MKKNICYILFTSVVLFASCKITKPTTDKQTTTENKKQEETLIGRWKLVKLSGGIVGKEQDPPMGQVQVIEFTPTEMILIINGKEVSRNSYTTGKGKSIQSINEREMIFINANTSAGMSYNLLGDKLTISEEFHDGFTKHFERIGKNDDGLLRE